MLRKARLVAQEYSQKFGVDYDEVFAPMLRSVTMRTLLSEVGVRKHFVNQYDIKTAFLNEPWLKKSI
jgi:Reverse transcriptase (RNA-dependent DNA polymerase)